MLIEDSLLSFKEQRGISGTPLPLLAGYGALPETKQVGRQMSLEVILLFVMGTFEALFKMRKPYISSLFWDVYMQSLCLKRFGLNYDVDMQLKISVRDLIILLMVSLLIKCPAKENVWADLVQARLVCCYLVKANPQKRIWTGVFSPWCGDHRCCITFCFILQMRIWGLFSHHAARRIIVLSLLSVPFVRAA